MVSPHRDDLTVTARTLEPPRAAVLSCPLPADKVLSLKGTFKLQLLGPNQKVPERDQERDFGFVAGHKLFKRAFLLCFSGMAFHSDAATLAERCLC